MRKVSPLKNPFNSTASTSNCSQFPNIFQYNDRRLQVNSQASQQSINSIQNLQLGQTYHNNRDAFTTNQPIQVQQTAIKKNKAHYKQSQYKTKATSNQIGTGTQDKNQRLKIFDDLNIEDEFVTDQLNRLPQQKDKTFFIQGMSSREKQSLKQASRVLSQEDNFPSQENFNFRLSKAVQFQQKEHTLINEINQSRFDESIQVHYNIKKKLEMQDQIKTTEIKKKPRKRIFEVQLKSRLAFKKELQNNQLWRQKQQQRDLFNKKIEKLPQQQQKHVRPCMHAEVMLKSLQIVDKMISKSENQQQQFESLSKMQQKKEAQKINLCKLDIHYRKKIAQVKMQMDSLTNLTIEQIINEGKQIIQNISEAIEGMKSKILVQEYLNPDIMEQIRALYKLNIIMLRAQKKYLDYRVKLSQLKDQMLGKIKAKRKQKLKLLKNVNSMINALEQQIEAVSVASGGQKIPIQFQMTRFFQNQRNLLIQSFEVIKKQVQSQFD